MKEATQGEVDRALSKMKEATQEEVDNALSKLDSHESRSNYELSEFEDSEVENGTFNLKDPKTGDIMTDGGTYDILETGDNYAIVAVDDDEYLVEESTAKDEDAYKFEIIDSDVVCVEGTNFKSPEQVELTPYDTEEINSYNEVIDAVLDKSSVTTDPALQELIQF